MNKVAFQLQNNFIFKKLTLCISSFNHIDSWYEHKSCSNVYFIWYIHVLQFIIPHVNFPNKTSIDERLIFYNIACCYSGGEYCHVFAIASNDILKYQDSHMMPATLMLVRFVHVRRRSSAMADIRHDLATFNSQ